MRTAKENYFELYSSDLVDKCTASQAMQTRRIRFHLQLSPSVLTNSELKDMERKQKHSHLNELQTFHETAH